MPIALPVAILAASAISGGAAIASGAIGAHAAGSAADKEAAAGQAAADRAQTAGDTANNKIGDILKQQQDLLSPYASVGKTGLDSLTAALAPGGSLTPQFGYNPADVAKDPAYQFQLSEGLKAVQRAAAASGTLNSGGTLKALTQYAGGVTAGYENQDYGQALSTFNTNRNNTLQNLQLPIQAGEYGTSGLLQALQNYGNLFSSNTIGTANTVSNDLLGKANAQAAGTVGAANAYTGALSSLSNTSQLALLLGSLTKQPGAALPADPGAAAAVADDAAGQRSAASLAGANATAPSAFNPNNLSGYAGTGYGAPPVTPINWAGPYAP